MDNVPKEDKIRSEQIYRQEIYDCIYLPSSEWLGMLQQLTVMNNVFPLQSIKYLQSGSLGSSPKLKGASTAVTQG